MTWRIRSCSSACPVLRLGECASWRSMCMRASGSGVRCTFLKVRKSVCIVCTPYAVVSGHKRRECLMSHVQGGGRPRTPTDPVSPSLLPSGGESLPYGSRSLVCVPESAWGLCVQCIPGSRPSYRGNPRGVPSFLPLPALRGGAASPTTPPPLPTAAQRRLLSNPLEC